MLLNFWKRKASASTEQAPSHEPPKAQPAEPRYTLIDLDQPANQATESAPAINPLPEFGDKERLLLYRSSQQRQLQADEPLFKAGERLDYIVFVTKGELRLDYLNPAGKRRLSERLGKGHWIADNDLTSPQPAPCSATATQPSSVMLIDKGVLAQLDEPVRLTLLGQIHHLNAQRIKHLQRDRQRLQQRNELLVEGLSRATPKFDPVLANSTLIQELVSEIPRLPVSTSALLGKLMDQSSTTREIVELVQQDQSLAASVLKTINSPRYAFTQKIADINHAVALLGYDGVYQIVMASGIRQCLPQTDEAQAMFERSLAVSSIAFALSQRAGVGQPAELATIGLLHQIGILVTEQFRLLHPAMAPMITHISDTDMGATLLRAWGIPETVCKSIEQLHYPEYVAPTRVDPSVRRTVALIYLAKLCYQRLSGDTTSPLPVLFLRDYMALLGWKKESLNSLLDQVLKPHLRKQQKTLPAALKRLLEAPFDPAFSPE